MNISESIEKLGVVPVVVLNDANDAKPLAKACLLYTSPSPRDGATSRMPSSA